jgi:hypothetical protein
MELDGETAGRQADAEVGLPGQSSVGSEKFLFCPRVDEVLARCATGAESLERAGIAGLPERLVGATWPLRGGAKRWS